jgi:circadian clock protein KaiC
VTERFSTGNSRLDTILGGGLVRNSITLVVGAPGSGKTLLAEQCLFENASVDRPGLYLSTVSEPLEKLLRYGQSLGFFDIHEIGRSVFYEELGSVLDRDGLLGVLERVDALLKEHMPGIVVIDSFKALNAFAQSEEGYRRFLHDLTGRLTAVAVSSLWIGEYAASDAYASPEFAVADAVINLATKRTGERTSRYLDVVKLRGSNFSPGEHVYRLSSNGLVVFPRLADARDPAPFDAGTERVSTGIPALDDALGDGYWSGSATLVAGPTGAGKTLLGLHFLFEGAARGEAGIHLTLQESSAQLSRIVKGFGWSIPHPAVTILDRSPVDVYIDELVYELLDCVDETNARRVVIDSLNDLVLAADDATRFREFVYSLVQRLARARVSIMFTLESPELFRISRLGELGMSHVADNVILLQHLYDGSEMKRALTVLKTRGSSHEAAVREFHIGREGITLGESLDLQLLLA